MSWSARLKCGGCGSCIGDWNYTHNTNGMIATAFESVTGEKTPECSGPLGPLIGEAWWKRLDGLTTAEATPYLANIVTGLESNPEQFRAMNPLNGWGDYDGLLGIMREMRNASDGAPSDAVWSAGG